MQPDETALPEDKEGAFAMRLRRVRLSNVTFADGSGLPEFNAEAMAQLEAMGFPTVRCQKALLATGNSDANAAMEWLFQHMEDPGECVLRVLCNS